jgi:hypothetical protein
VVACGWQDCELAFGCRGSRQPQPQPPGPGPAKNTAGDLVDQAEQSSAVSEKLDTFLAHVDTDDAETVGKAVEQAWGDIPIV